MTIDHQALIEEARANHRPGRSAMTAGQCEAFGCVRKWPCITARLAGALENAEQRAGARLEENNALRERLLETDARCCAAERRAAEAEQEYADYQEHSDTSHAVMNQLLDEAEAKIRDLEHENIVLAKALEREQEQASVAERASNAWERNHNEVRDQRDAAERRAAEVRGHYDVVREQVSVLARDLSGGEAASTSAYWCCAAHRQSAVGGQADQERLALEDAAVQLHAAFGAAPPEVER